MVEDIKFKNDKERLFFLDSYRNTDNGWYLWKEIKDIQRRWWRIDFDDFSIVVEEEEKTYNWPDIHREYVVVHWYIMNGTEMPFADYKSSRTLALAEIKQLGKRK